MAQKQFAALVAFVIIGLMTRSFWLGLVAAAIAFYKFGPKEGGLSSLFDWGADGRYGRDYHTADRRTEETLAEPMARYERPAAPPRPESVAPASAPSVRAAQSLPPTRFATGPKPARKPVDLPRHR